MGLAVAVEGWSGGLVSTPRLLSPTMACLVGALFGGLGGRRARRVLHARGRPRGRARERHRAQVASSFFFFLPLRVMARAVDGEREKVGVCWCLIGMPGA